MMEPACAAAGRGWAARASGTKAVRLYLPGNNAWPSSSVALPAALHYDVDSSTGESDETAPRGEPAPRPVLKAMPASRRLHLMCWTRGFPSDHPDLGNGCVPVRQAARRRRDYWKKP